MRKREIKRQDLEDGVDKEEGVFDEDIGNCRELWCGKDVRKRGSLQ